MTEQFAIARAYVLSRPRQTAVSVLGVMLGVGFYIGISALMQGFQQDFVRRIVDISPHIVIRDEFRTAPIQPAIAARIADAVELRGLKPRNEPRGVRIANEILADLAQRSDLAVAPTLTGQAFIRYGSRDVSVPLFGIDPSIESRVSSLDADMVEGRLQDLVANQNGLILGATLARKAGITVGNTVTLISGQGVTLAMKVVGLFETGIVNLDDSRGYVSLKKNQVLQARANVIDQIRIRLADIEQADAVARDLERRFGYKAETWTEANQNIFGIFVIQNGIMYSTVGAILLVSAFGIYNIISTIVNEKRHDVAILKSIGFSERDIRLIFVFQGLIVGCIGVLLGWVLGYLLTLLLASIEFDIEGMIRAQGFILNRSIWHYISGGGIAILVSVLAAFLPARAAAALNPVDVIRGAA